MKSSVAARIGLVCAAVVTPVLLAAPAQAEPHPNACLVIENNTPRVATITLHNRSFQGSRWDVKPWDNTILTDGDRAIATSDGDWNLNGPSGSWRYEPDLNNARWGCSGSWVFTIN